MMPFSELKNQHHGMWWPHLMLCQWMLQGGRRGVQQLRCGTHACMGPDERCLHVDHQDAAWQSEFAEWLDPQGEEGPESAV